MHPSTTMQTGATLDAADLAHRVGPGAAERRRRRCAVAAAVLASLLGAGAPPADAGGGAWLTPARDRYEPGQAVTMIGYSSNDAAIYRDEMRDDGPFHVHLRPGADLVRPRAGDADPRTIVVAGEIAIEARPPDPMGRVARASVTFALPDDLAPGTYVTELCNEGCAQTLGDLISSPLHVGVDPAEPVVRDWPLTDPAIRWLEDDALLVLPSGQRVTAIDARAGRLPPPVVPTPVAPPAPSPAPQPWPEPPVPSVRASTAVDARPDAGAGGATRAPAAPAPAARPADNRRSDGTAALAWITGAATTVAAAATAVGLRRRRGQRPEGRTAEADTPSEPARL